MFSEKKPSSHRVCRITKPRYLHEGPVIHGTVFTFFFSEEHSAAYGGASACGGAADEAESEVVALWKLNGVARNRSTTASSSIYQKMNEVLVVDSSISGIWSNIRTLATPLDGISASEAVA